MQEGMFLCTCIRGFCGGSRVLIYEKSNKAFIVDKDRFFTIPKWLDTLAMERNVNFSNILQNALMRELGVNKA